jgi:hypothetical protein
MDINKFWKQVNKTTNSNECWEWSAGIHPFGYGRFYGKLTHRISYELHFGPLKKGECILHQCDNPKCVNPGHLKVGNRTDNARERTERNRNLIGSAVPNSRLSEKEVLEIRASSKSVKELSLMYGVGEANIYAIRARSIWKHI